MTADPAMRPVRAAFISDVHLGTRACQAGLLLEFIRHLECNTLYLVGDMIDGRRLKRGWYWPQAHNDVVQKILRLARAGTRVVYVPGNHDEFARAYCGNAFGGVEVVHDAIHETADGRRLLIVHGDEFDGVVSYARSLTLLGDTAYAAVLRLNTLVNQLRRRLGLGGYWSLSTWVKSKVGAAEAFVAQFEAALAQEARRRGCDGVICGHIHRAAIRDIGGILYVNDGDWAESCTAVVEHFDGRLEVIDWPKRRSRLALDDVAAPVRLKTAA